MGQLPKHMHTLNLYYPTVTDEHLHNLVLLVVLGKEGEYR